MFFFCHVGDGVSAKRSALCNKSIRVIVLMLVSISIVVISLNSCTLEQCKIS